MEETGTGLDQAVFANMNTIGVLFEAAKNKGFTFPENIDPETGISSIMVRVKEGYSASEVKHNIRSHIDGLQVIETRSMTNVIESGLGGFRILLYILLGILFVLTIIILEVTFSLSVSERRDRYNLMNLLGATGKQITEMILKETLIISILGSLTGVVIVAAFLFPFKTLITSSVNIPFLIPGAGTMTILFMISAVIGILSGPVSGGIASRRIRRN